MPTRLALILAVAAFAAPAAAQTSAKAPMHPSTLTLRSHNPRANATAHRNHRYHNHVHHTFNQPPHINGTMAGPRM